MVGSDNIQIRYSLRPMT